MHKFECQDPPISSVDPGQFTDSLAYKAAVAATEYQGMGPIDPKEANSCLQDEVIGSGSINSGTPRTCHVNECRLSANKDTLSCEGFCLKSVVGVRKPAKPIANPKY